jgi:hypothetical protein
LAWICIYLDNKLTFNPFKLHGNKGLLVAINIFEWEKVGWESSSWFVADDANIFVIGGIFTFT